MKDPREIDRSRADLVDLQGPWLALFRLGLIDKETRLTDAGLAWIEARLVAEERGGA